MLWNENVEAAVGRDGQVVLVPYLTSRSQTERWQAAGFDIHDAVDRWASFERSVATDVPGEGVFYSALDFLAAEERRLIEAGVPVEDPDLWKVRRAARYFGDVPQIARIA